MKTYEKVEMEKQKIKDHFKRERTKASLIFWGCDIAAVLLSYFLTKVIFNEKYLQWFIISLFFIVVFPITQYSKKQKELTKAQCEQIKFLEQDM